METCYLKTKNLELLNYLNYFKYLSSLSFQIIEKHTLTYALYT